MIRHLSNRTKRKNILEHIPLTINDDNRALPRFQLIEIMQDKMLQKLGFPMTRSTYNVHMLKTSLQRNRKGQRSLKKTGNWRCVQIGSDNLLRRQISLARHDDLLLALLW